MSLEILLDQSRAHTTLNPRCQSLIVDGTITAGAYIVDKSIVNKAWNPANADSVTMSGSGILSLTLNTTALLVGLISSKMTVNNSAVVATTTVLTNISQYSGLPSAYDGTTPVACPNIFVSDVVTGSYSIQIVSNGYVGMGATDTLKVFIAIR